MGPLTLEGFSAQAARGLGEHAEAQERHTDMTGQIIRLIRERGFGFLKAQDGREVFFHRTELQGTSFDALRGDEQVEYDMGTDARSGRERAVNLRVIQ